MDKARTSYVQQGDFIEISEALFYSYKHENVCKWHDLSVLMFQPTQTYVACLPTRVHVHVASEQISVQLVCIL